MSSLCWFFHGLTWDNTKVLGFVTSALIQQAGPIQTQEFSRWELSNEEAEWHFCQEKCELCYESRFLGIQMKSIEVLNSWEVKYSAIFCESIFTLGENSTNKEPYDNIFFCVFLSHFCCWLHSKTHSSMTICSVPQWNHPSPPPMYFWVLGAVYRVISLRGQFQHLIRTFHLQLDLTYLQGKLFSLQIFHPTL